MWLKQTLIILSFILLLIACGETKNSVNVESQRSELKTHAKEFMTSLKTVLQKNLKEGGPLKAISVCSDTALALTEIYSKENSVKVKRISFQNRNPYNKPDEFEEEGLNYFHKLKQEGKLKPDTEILKSVSVDGKEFARFMKPIIIDTPCLLCHGEQSQIIPQAAELIKSKYPYDKATGYKLGELRGAISITKEM